MMQKLMEINDHLVRTLAECEQLRSDQKTLQEICSIRLQRINELQEELRKACAERDELRKDQTKLQGICADGGRRIVELKAERDEAVEHAGRLQSELDATRKQLQDVCSVESAGQSDLVRDVSHYTEAAEVDTPVEPQPQPVQVREGRWRTRNGEIKDIRPCDPLEGPYFVWPWTDGVRTFQDNGRHRGSQESPNDLVEYLGPIEPEPQFKPYTFAAYIVGDKIQPDALRIVWATEEWIQQSKFGIVHRMRDMQFFGNDGGCNITEYHETLTLSLEVQ